MPHIDIGKGYVGEQEIKVVRVFDNLIVADEDNNRRYWHRVKGFFFTDDDLIIEAINPETSNNITITVGRRELNLKSLSGKVVKAVYDFSELTLEFENGKKKTYENVKSVKLDKRQRTLYMRYFGGETREMRIQNN